MLRKIQFLPAEVIYFLRLCGFLFYIIGFTGLIGLLAGLFPARHAANKENEIDSREKMAVFSDGLDVYRMFGIADHFIVRLKYTFGWGTNLMNDLGFPAASLAMKLVESNSHEVVKLSDNLAKAIGNPEEVERIKSVFGYIETLREECKY